MSLIVLIAAITVIAKCAEMEGKSGTKWGFITFGVCILTSAIPLPFINLVIGFAISFMLLFAAKVISNRV